MEQDTAEEHLAPCDGGFCGVPGTVRELRLWVESLNVTRLEFYFVFVSVLLVVILALRGGEIITALNERTAIKLDHKRQNIKTLEAIKNAREKTQARSASKKTRRTR